MIFKVVPFFPNLSEINRLYYKSSQYLGKLNKKYIFRDNCIINFHYMYLTSKYHVDYDILGII